nr:hypothetical protein [Tanacetum cinerariifolium]
MNRQLLDIQGPIPGMTHVQALTMIQTMADHSQKWHDGSSRRKIESSSNSEGISAIVSILDNLGRDIKKLKENMHAIQVRCQNCEGAYLGNDYPFNKEVKSLKKAKYSKFGRSLPFSDGAKYRASVNVIPKSMFEHLKLAQLKKTDMLVEMTDMMKISPIEIVENVFVKIDKFLFPSNFVVMDMLNIRIGGDRITFDMNNKIHNFTTPVGRIYMINSIHNEEYPSLGSTPLEKSSRFEKSNNNYDNHIQERRNKQTRMLKSNTNLPSTHFCKPVKQICNGIIKVWPTCDPPLKACNEGIEVYGMNEEGNLKRWHCYLDDDRGSIKGGGLSFPEFLLRKRGCSIDALQEFISCSHHSMKGETLREVF